MAHGGNQFINILVAHTRPHRIVHQHPVFELGVLAQRLEAVQHGLCAGFAAGILAEKLREICEHGDQRLPVTVLIGDTDHDTAHARIGAQAFERVQDDGTAKKKEILLGLRGLHTQALATRRYQSPDSVCCGQAELMPDRIRRALRYN